MNQNPWHNDQTKLSGINHHRGRRSRSVWSQAASVTDSSTKLTSCGRGVTEPYAGSRKSTVATVAGSWAASRRLVTWTASTTSTAPSPNSHASPAYPKPRWTYAATTSGSGSVGTHETVANEDQWSGVDS